MRTPLPLVSSVALAGVALVAILVARRDAPVVQAAELAPPSADPASTTLAAAASPEVPAAVPALEPPEPERRRVAEDPAFPGGEDLRRQLPIWRAEFEALYAGSSDLALASRRQILTEELAVAARSRFDELHADFETQVRSGAHRARYVRLARGSPFRGVKSKYCSARIATDAEGEPVYQLLEFDPAHDASTARLAAEIAFLRERLDAPE